MLVRRERWISRARLLVFAVGLALAWLAVGLKLIAPWWLAVPLMGFVALVAAHHRSRGDRERSERALAYYERGLARLEDRWVGGGENGDRFRDESHPYAEDLDLFGRGSLFEFLCNARTRAGEEVLAGWLRAAGDSEEIGKRQAAVGELCARLELREDLAVIGADVRAGLHPEELAAWATGPPLLASHVLRVIAAMLATSVAVAAGGWALGGWGGIGLIPFLLAEGVVSLALRRRVSYVIRAVERPGRDLALLAQLLRRVEQERFSSDMLVALRASLETAGISPSRRIQRLSFLTNLLDARRNELFAPIAASILWATQCALAIEAWRIANGPAVAGWLTAMGETEALCSLASFAYEHPGDAFPEMMATGPCFDAEDLGHPLLPESRCVRNDVRLGRDLQVLVVSGSNMSGKSTLLRSVGANAVLALMGAPVRARRLRLSPLAVGASIRVHDSLQTGTSRFYAEITRLRQLSDLAQGPRTLLFLLDEILHGTNSHDRRIGAEAVVRGLVERGAVGLVTTHDLALARIAEALAPRGANVHFEDHVESDRMIFDYRVRPGVVTHSNALALMRSIGFDV
jgi:MutS domain V